MKRTKLYRRKKNGRYTIADRTTICETASEYCDPIVGVAIRSPADTESFLRNKLAHLPHELFCCIYLDNRHRVLKFSELFRGTIDGTSVYPREIVKEALFCNAAAVILAHNHPSGVAEPSQADERITKRIKAALEVIDIRLLDHIIIGGRTATSCASRGIL
jgi:DNA repair protein RadC